MTTNRPASALGCAAIAIVFFAAPTVSSAEERYESLFRDGRAAMDAHDYQRACPLFRESLDVGAPVGALLNLADCEDKRGHVAQSLAYWREGFDKLPPNDPRRDLAKRQIEDVDRRVGKIGVVWPGSTPDVKSFVDGRAVRIGGDPEPVDPGAHKITVTSAAGTRTLDVAVQAGELRSVDVSPSSTSTPSIEPPGKGMLIGGATSVALGGAGAVGAAITGGIYFQARSTLDKRCPDRTQCSDPAGISASQRGKAAGKANIAMFVIAAAGTGVGVTLLVLDATRSRSDHAVQPTAKLQWTGTGGAIVGTF